MLQLYRMRVAPHVWQLKACHDVCKQQLLHQHGSLPTDGHVGEDLFHPYLYYSDLFWICTVWSARPMIGLVHVVTRAIPLFTRPHMTD